MCGSPEDGVHGGEVLETCPTRSNADTRTFLAALERSKALDMLDKD